MIDKHTRQASVVAASVSLSWAGMYLHNLVDLPGITFVSPENLLPAAISLLLFLLWYRWPNWMLTSILLLVLGLLQLIGGALFSLLPLPDVSSELPRTISQISINVIYGLTQIPLIVVMILNIRTLYKEQSR